MDNWHKAQYLHNRSFLGSVNAEAHADWAITIMFYCAVKLVDAIFASERGTVPVGHQTRSAWVEEHAATAPMFRFYNALKVMSEDARYRRLFVRYTQADVLQARDLLARIEEPLLSRLP